MKRIFSGILLMTALLSVSSTMSAQSTSDKFDGHWFIQLQGGAGHTVGETSFGNLISPAASAYFGYRFTPVWALRAGIDGLQAKGALTGPTQVYKYNFLQGNIDVMADICSMFSGYRISRALSPYIFAGIGLNGAFNNSEANSINTFFPADSYLWDKNLVSPAGRFGIGTGIRISDAVRFNIEAGANALNDRFNSKRGSAVDWQITAKAGFTFNIGLGKAGKTAVQTAPAPYQPVPETKPAPAETKQETTVHEPENTAASVEKAEKPAVREYKESIYFQIGKYDIDDLELEKIDRLAEFLDSNKDAKVRISGYADSSTGSAKRNMYLSEKRAEAVAKFLEMKGIEAYRITTEYKGDSVQPYDTPEKNRVAICITY